MVISVKSISVMLSKCTDNLIIIDVIKKKHLLFRDFYFFLESLTERKLIVIKRLI